MSFFKNLVLAIEGVFRRKPRQETFVTKMPSFDSIKEVMDFINEKHLEDNAQLTADNLRMKEREEARLKQKKREHSEMDLVKAAYEQKLEIQKETQSRTLKLKIVGLQRPPTFFLKNNRGMGFLWGFILQEGKDGSLMIFPWIKGGAKKNAPDFKFNKPVFRLLDMFKEEVGVVSQMRAGKIDTNYDIDDDSNPVLRPNKVIFDKKDNEGITVKDLRKLQEAQKLGEAEKRDFELKITQLQDQINRYGGALMDQEAQNEELSQNNADLKLKAQTEGKSNDILKATVAAEADNKIKTVKILADSQLAIQDTKVQQILTERLNNSLTDAMTRLRKKYADSLFKEERDVEETKQRDMMRGLAKEVIAQQTALGKKPPAAAPPPEA